MSKAFSMEQFDEASSLIHNEQKCVSICGVSQQHGISRSSAVTLLAEIVKNDKPFQLTNCVMEKKNEEAAVPCSVFKLVKEDSKQDAMETDDAVLYAAALKSDNAAESLSTGFEREMAVFRDNLKDNRLKEFDNSTSIAPAPEIKKLMEQKPDVEMDIVPEGAPTSNRSTLGRGPKKTTTAKNFFAKSSKTSKATASKSTKPPKKSAVSFSTKEGSKENNSKETTTTTTTAKKSVQKKASYKDDGAAKTKVGDADDFVGDLEDSDDDDDSVDKHDEDSVKSMEIEPVQKSQKMKGRRQVFEEDDDDDDAIMLEEKPKKKKPVVTGAMDAFTTTKEKPANDSAATKKRRRKKLVDKTTVDSNGYLHTETQEVWEDVASDEEDKGVTSLLTSSKNAALPKKQPGKKKSGAKSNMKQGNLMGFFKKK